MVWTSSCYYISIFYSHLRLKIVYIKRACEFRILPIANEIYIKKKLAFVCDILVSHWLSLPSNMASFIHILKCQCLDSRKFSLWICCIYATMKTTNPFFKPYFNNSIVNTTLVKENSFNLSKNKNCILT